MSGWSYLGVKYPNAVFAREVRWHYLKEELGVIWRYHTSMNDSTLGTFDDSKIFLWVQEYQTGLLADKITLPIFDPAPKR